MRAEPRSLIISGRIYCLLLHAYPRAFQQEYSRHMAQVFRDETYSTMQESGVIGLFVLWLQTLMDLLKTAFFEHLWEVFHMPIEKLSRWSGPAAVIGGLFWPLFTLLIFADFDLLDSMSEVTAVIFASTIIIGLLFLWLWR